MSLHQRTHPVPQPDCFGCKVASLNWGIVPGAYRDTNSTSMHDREDILKQLSDKDGNPLFNKERVNDTRSDFLSKQRDFLSYE